MTTAVGHLFRHLCGRVTEADIWDFRVDDGGCVRPWTEIQNSRLLPAKVPPDFLYHDVTEPIKLYSYHDAETEPDPFRFRVYRLFIMTVACHLLPREGSDAVQQDCYAAEMVWAQRERDWSRADAAAQILIRVGTDGA
jgi:hypothetical protein